MEAESTRTLTWSMAIATAVITVGVLWLAVHAARAPAGRLDHDGGMRVILWLGAVGPTLILTALLVTSLPTMRTMATEPDDLVIAVEGEQFWWRVRYEPSDVWRPTSRPTSSRITSHLPAPDENSGPQNSGCANCRGVVTIERSTGNVTYNGEYYALGHASLAARPGAVRVESSQIAGLVDTVAFLNPDGSKGLLVLNERREPTRIEVRWAGQAFAYELPAQAVATFTWP